MAKKREVLKIKERKNNKANPLVPKVIESSERIPVSFGMDGTSHVEISVMQNINYSSEIIPKARAAFNLNKLTELEKKDEKEFLIEGERQISVLWHSIEALTTHNTLFVVLFLVAIGEILNVIKAFLKPHEYVKWRRKAFHFKHERYLQQAQQLARMGNFARKYASMGKKRLLTLDHFRNAKGMQSCEEIFNDYSLPNEISEITVSDKELEKNKFPDSTEDLGGNLLKEHVDGILTHDKLKEAGINFVSFDQACLLAAYNKAAVTEKDLKKIKVELEKKRKISDKKKWFDIFLMDKMHFPGEHQHSNLPRESINKLLTDFVSYCQAADLDNENWIRNQREILHNVILIQANQFIKKLGRKFKIKFSATQRLRKSGNNKKRSA